MNKRQEKKYRLSTDIEEELRRLLRPETDSRPVPITLRFGFPKVKDEQSAYKVETLPDSLRNRLVTLIEMSREIRYEATYQPHEYRELHEGYTAIEKWPIVEVWIGNHPLPYGGNLWLPLLFHYLVEEPNPFTVHRDEE